MPVKPRPAAPATGAVSLSDALGARVRALRTSRGWSLADLSQATKISVAMLSHIERGQTTPSLKTLERLRVAFGLPLAQLFPESAAPAAEAVVVRADARQQLRLDAIGLTKSLLSPARMSGLELLELAIEPGGGSGPEPWVRSGEKAGVVLAGTFVLEIAERTHVLEPGDSFQFDSSVPHRFSNPGETLTRVVWVINSDAPG